MTLKKQLLFLLCVILLAACQPAKITTGVLDVKTKELLGLVASMVLRCDDCIKYHLGKAHELKTTSEELYEVFAVAHIVGGTIVVPHTRRAAEYWEELQNNPDLI